MKDFKFTRTSMEFSQKEIEDLARKLVSVKPELTDPERALLLAVFSAASDHVSLLIKDSEYPGPENGDLREKILQAFIPFHEGLSGEGNEYVIECRIGTDPLPPPPPGPPPPLKDDSRTQD
jgi:hypothetical protein